MDETEKTAQIMDETKIAGMKASNFESVARRGIEPLFKV